MRSMVGSFEWAIGNGQTCATHELRPIVDELNGRLYAATGLGAVVLLKEFESYRTRCARDLAITFWGDPANWRQLDEHMVGCKCAGCSKPVEDFGSAWRLTSTESGLIKARHIMRDDAGEVLELEEHHLYESPYKLLGSEQATDIDVFATMVEMLGEPYDMATGKVNAAYTHLYRTS